MECQVRMKVLSLGTDRVTRCRVAQAVVIRFDWLSVLSHYSLVL